MVGLRLEFQPRKYGKRQPATARDMSEVERAWVGAMLEGEGSTFIHPDYRDSRPSFTPHIGIGNTEIEVISAIVRATGLGGVSSREKGSSLGSKRMWVWQTNAWNDVLALLPQLLPYSTKAQKLWAVLYG